MKEGEELLGRSRAMEYIFIFLTEDMPWQFESASYRKRISPNPAQDRLRSVSDVTVHPLAYCCREKNQVCQKQGMAGIFLKTHSHSPSSIMWLHL
jgi:hypothetical protein